MKLIAVNLLGVLADQLMQHEPGWDVVNCYDEWSGGLSNQGRDGKREGGNIEHRTPNIEHRSEERRKTRTNPALQRLNPDLPVEGIEGAVEEGSERDAPATACGETPQPLSAERLLQFAHCGIPVFRVIGIHEDDN